MRSMGLEEKVIIEGHTSLEWSAQFKLFNKKPNIYYNDQNTFKIVNSSIKYTIMSTRILLLNVEI